MIMYVTMFSMTTVFFILSLFSLSLGIYMADSSFMIIAVLFAVAGLLSRLEMKELLLNPFTD
jgi:hypothetical protein